jgi:hypothetical protein
MASIRLELLWANSRVAGPGAGTAVGSPQRGHSQIVPILRREILSICRHFGQAKWTGIAR